jgi:hypothetical protein
LTAVQDRRTPRIREKLLLGKLPRGFPSSPRPGIDTNPPSVRLVAGAADVCSGCDEPIHAGELRWEFEYEATLRVRFHESCERVWEEELALDQGE